MVPCCLKIISREEYDRLVEEDVNSPRVGGALGKHHSCPKNAEEAHQIVSGNSYIKVYEKNSLKTKMSKYLWKLNSHVYHLGKCKNHGEKCGRQGSKDYGKCCEEGMCAGPAGGVTHCVEGIF